MVITPDPEFTGPPPKPAPVESRAVAGSDSFLVLGALIIFTTAALGLHAFAWKVFATEWRTLHVYAETTCKVVDKVLKKVDTQDDVTRPKIQIQYTVGGREYRVWTFNAPSTPGNDEEANRAAVASFAVGGTYPCWYDPADAGRVVVVRGHSWYSWLLLGFTAVLVLLGLVSFVNCLRSSSAPRTRPSPPEIVLVGSKPSPPGLDTTPIECDDSSSTATYVTSCDNPEVFLIKPRRIFYRVIQGLLAAGLTSLAVVGGRGIELSLVSVLLTALGIGSLVIAGVFYHALDTHRFDRRSGQYRRSVPLRRSAAVLKFLSAKAQDPRGGLIRWVSVSGLKVLEFIAIFLLDAQRVERPSRVGPAPARRISVIPLDAILAIQFLGDVFHPSDDPTMAHDRNAGHLGNQVNLVLDDPTFPRQNLIDQGDREATARIARELADFLGVPLYGRS